MGEHYQRIIRQKLERQSSTDPVYLEYTAKTEQKYNQNYALLKEAVPCVGSHQNTSSRVFLLAANYEGESKHGYINEFVEYCTNVGCTDCEPESPPSPVPSCGLGGFAYLVPPEFRMTEEDIDTEVNISETGKALTMRKSPETEVTRGVTWAEIHNAGNGARSSDAQVETKRHDAEAETRESAVAVPKTGNTEVEKKRSTRAKVRAASKKCKADTETRANSGPVPRTKNAESNTETIPQRGNTEAVTKPNTGALRKRGNVETESRDNKGAVQKKSNFEAESRDNRGAVLKKGNLKVESKDNRGAVPKRGNFEAESRDNRGAVPKRGNFEAESRDNRGAVPKRGNFEAESTDNREAILKQGNAHAVSEKENEEAEARTSEEQAEIRSNDASNGSTAVHPKEKKQDPSVTWMLAEIRQYREESKIIFTYNNRRLQNKRSAETFLDVSEASDDELPDFIEMPQTFPEDDLPEDYQPSTSQASSERSDSMGNSLEEHERKIIIEFCHLLEKSKQLFNGLRELPQYGHKQWHSYFGRTFDVYTKLWKFQQQHRNILDSKYGLKRWQIGEIASKIGQLYYHFYLRTSETAYLNEAFSFYLAIRSRCYYTQASKEDKCELMVKKLRYYARFIVVCLLLKKANLVTELITELERQIDEYGTTYKPDDQVEWTVVVEEVRTFTVVEPPLQVVNMATGPIQISHRLSLQSLPPVERTPQMSLSLQEVLVIGSNSTQVKFSELTMDMYRIMQTLEREPTGGLPPMYDDSPRQIYSSTPSAVNNKGYTLDCGMSRSDNPHKYLLFKPSPSQIFVFLASGCNELPPHGVIMIYISADGITVPSKHPDECGYDMGGLITTSKTDIGYKEGKPLTKIKENQVLYPGDLYPYTRRPMFLIIESDNSYIFQHMPRHFGQPMLVLMSPLDQPSTVKSSEIDKRAHGSLFTLFLHSPISALCFTCDVKEISVDEWERAQSMLDHFMSDATEILLRSRTVDLVYIMYMGDDFLRLLILRFIFCDTVMRLHRAFRSRSHLPRVSPQLPEELYEHPALIERVMKLTSLLKISSNFHDPGVATMAGATGPLPSKE